MNFHRNDAISGHMWHVNVCGGSCLNVWCDCITNVFHSSELKYCDNDNFHIIQRIRAKIAHFEDKLPKLREITTILELALWKMRMNEKSPQEEATLRRKKIKTDESSIRQQCRVTCGANVVSQHVLPFLISVVTEESD